MRLKPIQAIFVGGIVSGLFDIAYAFVSWGQQGIKPDIILQSISSGLFGRAAFEGGAGSAALGALLHFAMTFAMAALFMALMRRSALKELPAYLSGPLYGAAIYLLMNRLVVPHSAYPGPPTNLTIPDLAVHMFLVGFPIALAARLAQPRKLVRGSSV